MTANAILLAHQFESWQLMYNPSLSLTWLQQFLNGQVIALDAVEFRLHDRPGDMFIQAERSPAVVYKQSLRIWPWQTTEQLFSAYQNALVCMQQHQVLFATPLCVACHRDKPAIRQQLIFLRDFVTGIPVSDYFHSHTEVTGELTSLAAEVVLLIKKLAMLGFQVNRLGANDIILQNKRLILCNWWRLIPLISQTPDIRQLHLSTFFTTWQKRVDFHELFIESFSRIDVGLRDIQS